MIVVSSYDIVFLIDNTGSMSPYIKSVKENVTSLVRTLQKKELDFRLGLVEYGDKAEELGVPKKHSFSETDSGTEGSSVTYFTTDVEKFIEEVNLIEADAGGDLPESGLEAIMESLTLDFNDGAFKNFIVVTDADFHNEGEYGDGDYSNYLKTSDVMAALSNANVQLNVISMINDYIQHEWEPLVEFTGGTFFNIENDFTFVLNAITREPSIPDNPLVYNGHSYFVFNADELNVNSWEAAQAYCKARGGHLAVITSAEENEKIYEYMVSGGVSSAYFGLTDSEIEGSWKWANGEALDYTNWTEYAPSESYSPIESYYNIRDYAAFEAGGGGKWVDETYYNYYDAPPKYFICEWSPKEAQAGSGTDSENSQDDTTIELTPNDDNFYNSGKRVIIYGLDGNDNIYNFAKDLSSRGEDVTINAGKGNDLISCRSSDHVVYNVGDGSDTIYCNWQSSHTDDFKFIPAPALTIHLESGNFRGATLGRTYDEVILKVNYNTITLPNATGKPIKIIEASGTSFEFNGGICELKKFERDVVGATTITAENHSGYYGERINSRGGTVEIEPGDKVTTNTKGNVNCIQIADKSHRIKAQLNNPVKIQDADGNQIAEVLGEVEIYWNAKGRPVIEAADKDKAIAVDATADDLDIIGSDKEDRITFAGKGNSVDSGLGNDFIQSNGLSATIVGGSDDDTIKLADSDLSIKLNLGTVTNSSLDGSNVIITTNYDHVITVQDGQDKNITVTNGKNKTLPTFSNEYAGDPDVLIDKAADLMTKARSDLESRTAEELESSFNKIDSNAADELDSFKKSFKMMPGSSVKLDDIPKEVFETFAKKLYEQVTDSKIGTLNALKPASWIGNVANAVKNIGVEEYTVGDYTVSTQKFIAMKTGAAYITIKKNGETWAQLIFADSQDKMISAAEDYLKALSTLNEDAWWRVVTGLVQDATGSSKAGKYLTYAKEIIKAIADPEDYGTVDKTLVSVMKKELNPTVSGSVVEGVIKEHCPQPLKKIILDGCEAYRDIKKYNTQLNATASFSENEKIYKNLLDSYTTLENVLNGKLFSPGQILSFFGGLLGLKASASGLSEESFDNDEKTAYISESGEVTDDAEKATGSLKVEETKLVYAALKPEPQRLSFGSLTDSKNWDVKTLEGDDEISVATNKKATLDAGAGNDTVVVDGSGDLLISGGAGDDVTKIRSDSRSVMTIEGGTGDDIIYSNRGAHVFKFKPEDGEDTVYDYDSYNTLEIASGNVNNIRRNENGDVIISVALGGKINLKDSADKAITIKDSVGETTSKIYENTDETPWFTFDESETGLIFSNAFDGDKLSLEKFDKKIKSIDASGITRDVDIFGNEEANTLIGGASKSTLTGGAGEDLFIYAGGQDVISDYDAGEDKISLGENKIADVEISDNDIEFSFADGSLTIADGHKDARGKSKKISMGDDKKFLKFTFDDHKIFTSNKKSVTLTSAEDFDASGKDYSKLEKIYSTAADKVHITGNGRKNYITAGSEGSTLDGGKGKDTLVGGNGADVFIYSGKSGNKFISGFEEDDTLNIVGAKVSEVFAKKDDAIFKIGSNKISIEGGADKTITFNEDGTIKTFSGGVVYDEGKTSATFYPKYSSREEQIFGDTVTEIDASATRTKVNLTATSTEGTKISGGKGKDSLNGGAGGDYISGGKGKDVLHGNAGDDTLSGGKGNDTLWGDAGSDTFLYANGEGQDVIYGFDNSDMLNITGNFSASFNEGKNEISFKVGSGRVTLKDFTATEFNINSEIYAITDGGFQKK